MDRNRLIKITLILKFPQMILIIFIPMFGMAEMKLVITIIAQYDICLHTNEYPINDSNIIIINIINPDNHILYIKNDLNIIPRVIWMNIIINSIDVIFL